MITRSQSEKLISKAPSTLSRSSKQKTERSWLYKIRSGILFGIQCLALPVALINILRLWYSNDDAEAKNILVDKQIIFLVTLGSSFVVVIASSFSETLRKICSSIALAGGIASTLSQYFSRLTACAMGCNWSQMFTTDNPYYELLGYGAPLAFLTLHGVLRYYYKTPGSKDMTVLLTLSWNAMEIPRSMLDKTTIFQRGPYTQIPMLSLAGAASLVPVMRLVTEKCSCTKKSVEVKESKSSCISMEPFKKIGRFLVSGKFIIMPMYVGSALVTMIFNLFSDSISIDPADIMWTGALIGISPAVIFGVVLPWIDRNWIHPNQESIVQTSESQKQLAAGSHMEFTTREKSQSLAIAISNGDGTVAVTESKLPRSRSQTHLSYSPPSSSQMVIISNSNSDSPPDQALVPSSKSDSPKRETDSPRSKEESEKSGRKTPPSPEHASSKGSTPPSPEAIIKGDSPVSSSLVVKVERTRSPSPTEAAAGKKNVTVVIPSSLFFPVCSSSAVAESRAKAIAAATTKACSDFDSEPTSSEPSTRVPYSAFWSHDESERPAAHAPSKPPKDRSCLDWLSCLWPGNWCGQGAAPNSEFPIPLRVADSQAGHTCGVGLSVT